MSLPLTALLSQALVAFTIEFENEFERRMPHRTSNYGGSRQGPWLVSLVMWSNWKLMASVYYAIVLSDKMYNVQMASDVYP